jgi:hypothetical protein
MKKLFFSFIVVLLCVANSTNAQNVKESVEPFEKGRQPAFSLSLDYPKNVVEEALNNRLKKDKQKGKSSSGFMEYIQAEYATLCDGKCNFYTKVTGNSKSATIYIFISKEYQHFVSSGDDPETGEKAKEFLKTVLIDVRNYSLQLQIDEQEGIVTKAQKDYSKLLEEKEKLQRRQNDLDKDIKNSEDNLTIQKGIYTNLKQTEFEKY